MKVCNHFLDLVLLLIYAASMISCASRRSEPVKQKEFIPRSQEIANGERLYMYFCQKCHPAGEAGLGPSVNANPAPQFVNRFQVRHGLGVMPAFNQEEISTAGLRDISKFMKAWKRY
jgi:mono/diheme cytochrome c family protein